MKFTSLLSKLIVENTKFQFLYDKYVKPQVSKEKPEGQGPETEKKPKSKGMIPFEVFKAVVLADPFTKVPEGEDIDTLDVEKMKNIKLGKYSEWLLKRFLQPTLSDLGISDQEAQDPAKQQYAKQQYAKLFLEDLYKQTERLQFYEKAKQYLPQDKRDINKLSIKDLYDIFQNFQLPEKKRIESERKEAKKTRKGFEHVGGEIIHQGPKWTMIRISDTGAKGKEAAIWYGGFKDVRAGETDWCTSSPNLSFFEGYIKDGPLYVVFPNDDKGEVGKRTGLPKERYQFHFPSNQFMDREDNRVKLVELLNGEMNELKDIFKPEFAKGLVTKDKDTLDINYPQGSAAQFVALYGMDEIFNSAPQTISSINIINNSKDNIALDVPKTISRFQSLQSVMFQNCVKSLPENLGELKKLKFISLPGNQELKSLPESISTLPDLMFVNVMDCPNVVLPKKLEETLEDDGNGFYFSKQ
jgi:hypothetical protein